MSLEPLVAHFVPQTEALPVEVEPGLRRYILAHSAALMVVKHEMTAGYAGSVHRHPHHQAVYIISGQLRIVLGDHSFIASAGDSFVAPGDLLHGATALTDAVVIDVFTPSREDYVGARS